MRTFAQKPKSTQPATSARSSTLSRSHVVQGHRPKSTPNLQRTISNPALLRLLQSNPEERNAVFTAAALAQVTQDFARIPVSLPRDGVLQTKLAINKPGDEYEQEADRVAEHVTRTAERRIQPEHPQIQRVYVNDTRYASVPFAVHKALQSPGQPLDPATREFMERRFGHDFSRVRVHAGQEAVAAAESVGAHAFTVGHHLVFGAGRFPPASNERRKLVAHELTHVVQQEGGARHTDTPVQRSASSEVLQRQPMPQRAKLEIKFRIGWLTDGGSPVETNRQVAVLARLAIASLQDNLGDVSSDTVKTQVTDWIAAAKGALPYFDRHGDEQVDAAIIPLINHQYDELLEVQEAVRVDRVIRIKQALWREHDATVKAAEEAEALQPALDDALRSAYRKGSSSTLKEVVSTVKGAISIGRSLHALAAEITKDIMGLPLASGTKIYVDHWTSQIGSPKITIIDVGKYTEMLGKLGRGLSALNIMLTIADRSKKATAAEQGMKDLSDAVNIGTDLITVSGLSAPAHFSIYTTLYLKPVLKVIAKQIGVLVENISDLNPTAVEVTGDLMYPNVEPGGQEMFDLMGKVMHANDESGFPGLSRTVEKYLFEHREKLSIGAEADVPTAGILFWKKLDSAAARRWLFANRKRVWAMFYGSMKVPAVKR